MRISIWSSTLFFIMGVLCTLHFGFKYYWWIYYPSLGRTMGGPEYSIGQERLWAYGLWTSIVVAIVVVAIRAILIRRYRPISSRDERTTNVLTVALLAFSDVVLILLNNRQGSKGLWTYELWILTAVTVLFVVISIVQSGSIQRRKSTRI